MNSNITVRFGESTVLKGYIVAKCDEHPEVTGLGKNQRYARCDLTRQIKRKLKMETVKA